MLKNKTNEALSIIEVFLNKWNSSQYPKLKKILPTLAIGESDDDMLVAEWKDGEIHFRKYSLYEEDTLDIEDLETM